MKVFKFTAVITIEGIDRDDAVWNWDRISEVVGIVNTECIDIEEVA